MKRYGHEKQLKTEAIEIGLTLFREGLPAGVREGNMCSCFCVRGASPCMAAGAVRAGRTEATRGGGGWLVWGGGPGRQRILRVRH